jgi:hypothetical protein
MGGPPLYISPRHQNDKQATGQLIILDGRHKVSEQSDSHDRSKPMNASINARVLALEPDLPRRTSLRTFALQSH